MSDDLVDRLRGIYRIPIKDGLGPVGAGEEPGNPDAFVRRFPSTPIQMEAAAEIARLRAQVEAADDVIRNLWLDGPNAADIIPMQDLATYQATYQQKREGGE